MAAAHSPFPVNPRHLELILLQDKLTSLQEMLSMPEMICFLYLPVDMLTTSLYHKKPLVKSSMLVALSTPQY